MKAAADDVGAGLQRAALAVDSQHDCHEAFFAQQDTVFDNDVINGRAGLVN